MKTLKFKGLLPKPSLLERLAQRIEPKPEEKPIIEGQSRVARLVSVIRKATGQIGPHVAIPTSKPFIMHDGDPMVCFSDGSLHHAGGYVKGKAKRKALKRMRRKFNERHEPSR